MKPTVKAKPKQPRVALITNCSGSRRYPPQIRVDEIPLGSMAQALEWWTNRLEELEESQKVDLYTPEEIYQGPAYTVIKELHEFIKPEDTFIVTGGQGLIGFNEKIVPYDFTSDKNLSPNIHERMKHDKFIPTGWWKNINKVRRGIENPIAELLNSGKYDMIVGALTKGFIKYIADDLGCINDAESKAFIPIPRSMLTSFHRGAQRALVPYGREYMEDVRAFRYDAPHRAVQKFLRLAKESSMSEVAVEMRNTSKSQAVSRVTQGGTNTDYDAIFEEYPELLEVDIHHALSTAKALGVKIGGSKRFLAAWRGARGQIEVDVDADEMDKSKSVMSRILSTSHTIDNTDDMILERIGVFIKTLRDLMPRATFIAKDVCAWYKEMYEEELSAIKVSHMLMSNTQYLGIKGDRNGYTLA